MIFPFDNELTLCSIKGKYLKSKFINTSNEDYFISLSNYGNANKADINDDETYYVIVDSYTSGYAKNNLTIVETYDMDKLENPHVENGCLKLIELCVKHGFEVKRLRWDPAYKGIDDLLYARKKNI